MARLAQFAFTTHSRECCPLECALCWCQRYQSSQSLSCRRRPTYYCSLLPPSLPYLSPNCPSDSLQIGSLRCRRHSRSVILLYCSAARRYRWRCNGPVIHWIILQISSSSLFVLPGRLFSYLSVCRPFSNHPISRTLFLFTL